MGQEDRFPEKRAKILSESLAESNEPRWGYFGCSGPLAIGDNSYAPIVKRKPKEEAEMDEPLRQIQCNPPKKGMGTDIYFKFETSVALGDPYKDPGFALKKGKVTMIDPEAAMRPPGKVRYGINKLGYEYIEHKDTLKDPKEINERYKDYMPPRQILSRPPLKGGGGTLTPGVLFGMDEERKFPEHKPDDYHNAHKMRLKELEEHRAKLPELPFKGNDHGHKAFHPDTDVYIQHHPTHIPREKKPEPESTLKAPHENPFRPSNPSKKGVPQALLGGYYEYIGDPETKLTRKPKVEDEKAPFKGNVPGKFTNPTASVVCNTRNMRRERPASFARPSL